MSLNMSHSLFHDCRGGIFSYPNPYHIDFPIMMSITLNFSSNKPSIPELLCQDILSQQQKSTQNSTLGERTMALLKVSLPHSLKPVKP